MSGLIHATSAFIPGNTRALMANVVSRLSGSAERAAEIVKQEAQAIVPVDTGDLLLSIGVDRVFDNGQAVTVAVVAASNHAAYVEFGTGMRGASSQGAGPVPYKLSWPGMPAQPYLRPALITAQSRILEEFTR